mmetsp:Transcript_474/g.569  ORF Transcript_474/g.569 Transcript_474/m.569 type:complete len:87 (+) Transcript_474:251-511(+)
MHLIKLISAIHCARGPTGCKKCEQARLDRRWRLLWLHEVPTGATMPIMKYKDHWYEYTIEKTFDSKEEALHYAMENVVTELLEEDE